MNLTETNFWETGIYQLEESDFVLGGATGVSNRQAKQLANRTNYLKAKIDDAARVVNGILPSFVECCKVVGANVSKVGNVYTVTAGYIYYAGSIWPVDAQNLNTASGVVWSIVDGKAALVVDAGNGFADWDQIWSLKEYNNNAGPIGKIEMFDAGFGFYNAAGVGFGPCIGWQICNGNNGSPNLIDRFIMGANSALNNVGTTGGANSVSLTANQNGPHTHTMASGGAHAHQINLSNNDTGDGGEPQKGNGTVRSGYTQTDGSHAHTINSSGTGEAHENRPAFYVLAYRRKMS